MKQEMLSADDGDGIAVISERPAPPYIARAHGEGFYVSIHDTKKLSRENVNYLLTLLGVSGILGNQAAEAYAVWDYRNSLRWEGGLHFPSFHNVFRRDLTSFQKNLPVVLQTT